MDRRIKGVSICRGAPTISNLMFVDDSILFCQERLEVAEKPSLHNLNVSKLDISPDATFFMRMTHLTALLFGRA